MNGPPVDGAFTFWGEWEPQSEVRRLAWNDKGDIIMFGSNLRECFVIDTVFVIAKHSPIHIGGALPNWESYLHKVITMDLIQIPPWGLRLYGSNNWSLPG